MFHSICKSVPYLLKLLVFSLYYFLIIINGIFFIKTPIFKDYFEGTRLQKCKYHIFKIFATGSFFFAWMALNCCISLLKFLQAPMHRKHCFSKIQFPFFWNLVRFKSKVYLCSSVVPQTRTNYLLLPTIPPRSYLIFIKFFCILNCTAD